MRRASKAEFLVWAVKGMEDMLSRGRLAGVEFQLRRWKRSFKSVPLAVACICTVNTQIWLALAATLKRKQRGALLHCCHEPNRLTEDNIECEPVAVEG